MVGDKNGNLYVDDVAFSLHKGEQPRPGRLLFVGIDRASRVVADDINFPNGLTFLDDGKTLVAAETIAKKLTSFRVDERGDLHDRKLYADIATLVGEEAAPDGIWATQHGVWVATLGGHAIILVHDGELVRSIDTGEAFPIACCADGGSRLFVTIAHTAGLPLMDAIARKVVSADVVVYELENGDSTGRGQRP
jgi:sugar lactone lactonase YvrE